MEKNCETAAAINTLCSFHNERHLISYAALRNRFITESGMCLQRDTCILCTFDMLMIYLTSYCHFDKFVRCSQMAGRSRCHFSTMTCQSRMYYRILDPKMAAATTLTDIGYISVSVVGYDVIEERDVESDEIAGDSSSATWCDDDTNLMQEMRRSVGASKGRRHIAHVPVGVGDEVKELEER